MAERGTPRLTWDEARALLGVAAGATEAEVRAAYLENVRLHPPDRDPEQFERVRDAYELLRDPRARARLVLEGPDPSAALTGFLDGTPTQRRFVGPEPWLAVLKERRS